jgi:hypothetical protein
VKDSKQLKTVGKTGKNGFLKIPLIPFFYLNGHVALGQEPE